MYPTMTATQNPILRRMGTPDRMNGGGIPARFSMPGGVGALTGQQQQLSQLALSTASNAILPGSGVFLPVIGNVLGGDMATVMGGAQKVGDGGLQLLSAPQLLELFENPSNAASVPAGPKGQFDRIREYLYGTATIGDNTAARVATRAQVDDHTARSQSAYSTLASNWLKNANVFTRMADDLRRQVLSGQRSSYDIWNFIRQALGMAASSTPSPTPPVYTPPSAPSQAINASDMMRTDAGLTDTAQRIASNGAILGTEYATHLPTNSRSTVANLRQLLGIQPAGAPPNTTNPPVTQPPSGGVSVPAAAGIGVGGFAVGALLLWLLSKK